MRKLMSCTNAAGVAMRLLGWRVTCWQGQAERHWGRSIWEVCQSRDFQYNTSEIPVVLSCFCELFWVRKMGRAQLSWFNTVYSLMLSDLDTDRAVAQKRPLRWGMRAEENVSGFQNVRSSVSRSGAANSAPRLSGKLYQHTERAANQPIHQLLALKASLTPCAHQGLTSKMLLFFSRGQRTERYHGQFDCNKWGPVEWDLQRDCCPQLLFATRKNLSEDSIESVSASFLTVWIDR